MNEDQPRSSPYVSSVLRIAAITDPLERAVSAELEARRLVKSGRLSDATSLCEFMEAMPQERSWLYSEISSQRWAQGDRQDAEKLLTNAKVCATRSGSEWQQAEAFIVAARKAISVGWSEPCPGLISEAVRLASSGQASADMQDSLDSGSVLREAAVLAAEMGLSELANQASALIANKVRQERTIKQINAVSQRRRAG